jgi:hypothetical protein
LVICKTIQACALISVFCGAKFTDLARTPWIVRVSFEKAFVGKGKNEHGQILNFKYNREMRQLGLHLHLVH